MLRKSWNLDMDAVRAFNNELSSLYETKPPVSRAKMGAVTRAAIKAIKFYKHVVQSVEKFVLKCKPEYKIPGLYVIDSVVRQSRHQFGGDKDVFGPRFTKNIVTTFQSLLKCPPDDRSRVIRVLNLWQKNTVFPIEIIQALLDMASDPTNAESVVAAQRVADGVVLAYQRSHGKMPSGGAASSAGSAPSSVTASAPAPAPAPAPVGGGTAPPTGPEESLVAQQSDIVNTVTKLLQQTGEGNLMTSGQDVQLQQLQLLQQQLMMHTELMSHKPQQTTPVIDNNLLAQIKLLTDQLLSKTETPAAASGLPPPPPPPPPLPAMAQNVPEVAAGVGFVPDGEPRDITRLPHPGMAHERRDNQNASAPARVAPREMSKPAEPGFNKKLLEFDYGDSDDEEMDQNQNEVNAQQHHHLHHHHQQQPPPQQLPGDVHKLLNDPTMMQHIHNVSSLKSDQLRQDMQDPEVLRKQHLEQQQEQFNKEIEQSQYSGYNQDQDIIVVEEQEDRDRDYDRDRRRSRHSRDRSRSPKRRRHSRSRSRERRRSRDRHRRSRSRDYDREKQREKDRERKKKGLPPVKDKHISLCSTTLWFGHLAKYTTEDELRTEIENYGTIESIKMVPPRGCAFVNMTWRKDAAKAQERMKGLKLNSSALRVAWAPNMGVKESPFKDLWEVELGVTYIPWDRLPGDLTPLLDGAMVDEDTLPDHLKGFIVERPLQDREGKDLESYGAGSNNQASGFGGQNQSIPSSQHLPLLPPPMMIPPPGSIPPPGMSIPPPNAGQLPLPGQIPLPGQGNPPQVLPPSLLPPPGGPVSTPMALSRPPMATAAGPLAGSPAHGMSMDGSLGRPPVLPLNSSSSLMLPGQQPGLLARPGFPPGPPFGPPPNLRPGMPPQRPGMPPFPNEESKDWPNDNGIEEDMNEEDEGGSQGRGPPTPLLGPPPMMGMGMPGGQPPLLGPPMLPPRPPHDGPDGILPPHVPPGLMGVRLGPRGLPPMPLGNRFGSPGIRGMGPGGSPVRFVLGQRPNLVRPGGPFRLDNPRQHLGDRQSSPPRGGLPRHFGGGAASKKTLESSHGKSPVYGEESSSPEYGDDFDDSENCTSAAQDGNVCDGDPKSNPLNNRNRFSQGTGVSSGQTKSGRVSRWSDCTDENDKNRAFQDRLAGANGLPSDTKINTKSVPTHANQPVSEGMSEG